MAFSNSTAVPYIGTEEKGPQSPSKWWEDQIAMWVMFETLLGGTMEMRKAADRYLPKYPNETPDNYYYRLHRATLLNYFKRSVNGLVGKPFSQPITQPEDMPKELEPLLEDMDHQGNDLDAFSRTAFAIGLSKGLVHLLVDYPQASGIATLADEKAAALTPYIIILPPENVIAAYCEYIDGEETLVHVRIRECEIVRDGWEEKKIERIRVLEPGKWELWEKGKDEKYHKTDEGVTSLDYIPMVTFYAEREGFMRSRSPLLDLAHLNVAHWQSGSDQRNILSVSRFPILGASGVDPETKLEIGPNTYFAMRDAQAKLYYVEHNGTAIDSGRQDLEDLKVEMAMMGLQLLMPVQPGKATATAKALDSAEANCSLQSLVLDFQVALNTAIEIMEELAGIDTEHDDFEIYNEYGLNLGDAQELLLLSQTRAAKEISHEAYIIELKRRGVLPTDFDIEEDQKLIDAEPPPPATALGFPPRKAGNIPFQKKGGVA